MTYTTIILTKDGPVYVEAASIEELKKECSALGHSVELLVPGTTDWK